MMKHLLVALVLAGSFISVCARTEITVEKDTLKDGVWYLNGVTGLNLSQTALSNWSAGGESSYAGNLYLNGTLVRKSGNWLWANALALEYGLTRTETQGTQKVSDKIDFTTQLGYTTNNKWYYTAMGDFKSQFYKGYNYPDKEHYISEFFAPAYVNLSLGMEFRPNEDYSVYLSPAAGKFTFVQDDYLSEQGAFGVDPGDRFKAELGMYLKARAQKTIMENVTAITSVDFFTPYDKSFGNIDANWDLLISMKINKFLSASINTTLKYDDDVKIIKTAEDGTEIKKGPKVQFREMLGIGVAYNF
jgi:hypothetical protein